MIIDPAALQPHHRYRLLTSTVTPRPIAWVSTRAADGSLNLAPFSFFQALCGTPPLIMLSIGRRKGNLKDTLRNIQGTGEFVVNLVTETLAEKMNLSSGEYGPEVDEFALTGLTPAPSEAVAAPRVAESPVNLECQLAQIMPIDGSEYSIVVGQVLRWHVADGLLAPDGLVDTARLRPLGRLGRDEYVKFGEVFEIPRPRVQ